MNLLTSLTSVLSLLSVASCYTHGNAAEKSAKNVAEKPARNLAEKTVKRCVPNVYTKKVTENDGKNKFISTLRIAPDSIKADKVSNIQNNDHSHSESYISTYAYNSEGINLSSVGEIARNLDPEFVDASVNKEKAKRDRKKMNEK